MFLYIAKLGGPSKSIQMYSHCPYPFHKVTTELLKHVELLHVNCCNFITSSTSDQYRVKDAMHKLVPILFSLNAGPQY